MTKMDEIKKKEAIEVVKHIINMPKYNVIDHHTEEIRFLSNGDGYTTTDRQMPKGTTDILVIYLKK